MFLGAVVGIPVKVGGVLGKSFFEGTFYSKKVLTQMKKDDWHSFPEEVKLFENHGKRENIIGVDGKVREQLSINGGYKGYEGTFEFIKEINGEINHRYFNGKVKK